MLVVDEMPPSSKLPENSARGKTRSIFERITQQGAIDLVSAVIWALCKRTAHDAQANEQEENIYLFVPNLIGGCGAIQLGSILYSFLPSKDTCVSSLLR